MPALRCCGKRWNAGSDDFVLSSALAIGLRFLWLISAIVVFVTIGFDPITSECDVLKNNYFVLILSFWLLWFVDQFIVLGLEAAIMTISARGLIFELHKRRFLPVFLWARAIFYVLEVLLTIFGTYVSAADVYFIDDTVRKEKCKLAVELLTATRVFTGLSWALLLIIIILFVYYIDLCNIFSGPGEMFFHNLDDEQVLAARNLLDIENQPTQKDYIMHKSFRHSKLARRFTRSGHSTKRLYYHQSIEQKYYFKKFQRLWKCCRDQNLLSAAFRDIASGLSILFHNQDYVITDLIAGLKLVAEQHKMTGFYEKELERMKRWTMQALIASGDQISPTYRYETQRIVNFSSCHEKDLFLSGMYYLRYAMGTYGWPLQIYSNPCSGTCRLCCLAKCRKTHPRTSVDLLHDNCLMTNTAAIRYMTECQEREILFSTYSSDVYDCPFCVAVDHEKRTLVLSIRGSMSLKDLFTSFTISLRKLHVEEEPYCNLKTFTHYGLFMAANVLRNSLVDHDILTKAFQKFPSYGLVICGHSLGAGVAAVIGVMLKSEYPDLKCYCYSPMGGTFSFPLAEYSKTFITSYVVDCDVIPRVTVRSLIHLTDSMTQQMKSCQTPKYQLFLGNFGRVIKRASNSTAEGTGKKNRKGVESFVPVAHSVYLATKYGRRWLENTKTGNVEKLKKFIRRQEKVFLFPPGRIMVFENNSRQKTCCGERSDINVCWYANEDFSAIKLKKGMMENHFPSSVMAAFKQAAKCYLKPEGP